MEQTYSGAEREESSVVFLPYSDDKQMSLWSRIRLAMRRNRRGYQQIESKKNNENGSHDDLLTARKSRTAKRDKKHKKGSYDEKSSYVFKDDESSTSRCGCFSFICC